MKLFDSNNPSPRHDNRTIVVTKTLYKHEISLIFLTTLQLFFDQVHGCEMSGVKYRLLDLTNSNNQLYARVIKPMKLPWFILKPKSFNGLLSCSKFSLSVEHDFEFVMKRLTRVFELLLSVVRFVNQDGGY